MDAYYTKSKPKVVDYNPLTHMAFYNQQISSPKTTVFQDSRSFNSSPFINSTKPRPTSIVAKTIFSNKRSPSFVASVKDDSQRHYKTRARNKVVDTISGQIKEYSVERPRIEALDVSLFRDKMTSDIDYNSIKQFTENKRKVKSTDNIAGALRKEVPFLPYVNIFALRNNTNN